MAAQPAKARTTTERGLGWDHQQQRRRLLLSHIDGTPCWWCGRPMYREPTRNWDHRALHADHSTSRANGGRKADRLMCDTCNKQRGDGSFDDVRPVAIGVPVHLWSKSTARASATATPPRAPVFDWGDPAGRG